MLIPSETYDGLICAECVRAAPLVERRAGMPGWMLVEPDGKGFKVVGREEKVQDAARAVHPQDAAAGGSTTAVKASEDPGRTPDNAIILANESPASSADVDGGSTPGKPGLGKRALDQAWDAPPESKRAKHDWLWKGKGDVFLANGVRQALRSEVSVRVRSMQY